MKKRWWVLLLTGLFIFSALFIGCDELDDDDDDSGPSDLEGLVGTWVMATGTVNEDDAYYSSVTDFEENGDGVSYVMTYGTNDMYETWNFTWEDVEGELEIDPDGENGAFTVDFDFQGNDIVDFSYIYEGHREETYYRVTSNKDANLYGLWNLTSMSENGQGIPDVSGTVNFTNGGDFYINLMIGEEAITDTMSWSTLSNHIVVLDTYSEEITGQVIAYVIDGTTLTVSVATERGLQVNVFEKHEPGDIDPDLVGRWMTYSMTADGNVVDMREAIFFNEDGTGVSYHMDMDSDDGDDTEVVRFIWEVIDGELIVDTEQDEPMTIGYSIEGGVLTIDFTMEESAIIEVLVKWSSEVDSELVGEWILESETRDGVPNEEAYGVVTLNDDGTGEYTSYGDSDDFTWCVNDGYMLISHEDFVGFTGEYTVSAEQFVFSEIYSDGTVVSTFIPFVPSEDLDPDLFGTWIGSTRYIDGEIVDGYSIIVLGPDGSGVFAFELEFPENSENYYQEITWTTNGEGTLYLYEGETLLHTVTYAVNGDVATTELTNDNSEFVEQNYYRKTDNNPADMVGTWILESETLDGTSNVMMSMAATAELEADGSMTIYFTEYDEEMDEEVEEAYGEWCVTDGHFLMHFEEEVEDYMIAEAIEFEMPQTNIMEMTDPRDEGVYTFTYRKFEGTVDADMVGTWAMYLMTIQVGAEEWQDSEMYQTIIANADGTGTMIMAEDVEEDVQLNEYEVEEFDFVWLVSDGKLLVIDEDGRGNIMDYTLGGDFLQMTMDMVIPMEDETMVFAMVMDWVRHLGEFDPDVLGGWVLTDVLENGTSVGVSETVTLNLVDDGTGEYTEDTVTDNFNWSSSNGYLLVNVGGEGFPPNLLEGIEYIVETGELRITEYEVDYSMGMPQTIVYTEIFTRPTN